MQAASFSAAMRGIPVLQSNRRAPNGRVQRATNIVTKASVVAEPASLEVKSTDGSASGSASLSLRVADAETANGLVHRYVVMVRQNMRQVRVNTRIGGLVFGEEAGGLVWGDSSTCSHALAHVVVFGARCGSRFVVDRCRGMPRR